MSTSRGRRDHRSGCGSGSGSITPVPSSLCAEGESQVKLTFDSFASRTGEMNGAKFAKFFKDNKLHTLKFGSSSHHKLTSTDVDLVFAKVTTKARRTLNFEEFRHRALPLLAAKGSGSGNGSGNGSGSKHGSTAPSPQLDKLLQHLCKHGGGPIFKGTRTDHVRHHDDKSTYCGVYARGGPINANDQIVLGSVTSGFKSLADRSPADVRGCKLVNP